MREDPRKALLDYGCGLAWLRCKLGMTAEDLGRRAGIDTDDVERFERGELSATLKQLRGLSDGLGISLSRLFGTDEHSGIKPEGFRHAQVVVEERRELRGTLFVSYGFASSRTGG